MNYQDILISNQINVKFVNKITHSQQIQNNAKGIQLLVKIFTTATWLKRKILWEKYLITKINIHNALKIKDILMEQNVKAVNCHTFGILTRMNVANVIKDYILIKMLVNVYTKMSVKSLKQM